MKELQERKNKLAAEIRAMAKRFEDQGKAWKDDEERKAWETLNADYDMVSKELEDARAAEAVSQRAAAIADEERRSVNREIPGRDDTSQARQLGGAPDEETRARALTAWFRAQSGMSVDEQSQEAASRCGIALGAPGLSIPLYRTQDFRHTQETFRSAHPSRAAGLLREHRSLGTVSLSAGGALVPSSFVRQLEVNMLAYGGMLQVADVIRTTGGEEMSWPTFDDTSNEGAIVGQGVDVGSGTDPSGEAIVWHAYKFTSKVLKINQELLEDGFLDVAGMLGEMLGERLGRITNRKTTLGSGSGEPRGIVPSATLGRTTGASITFDDFLRLEHSIDPAYRGPGSGYMMHDAILLAARLLKDSTTGQYLWQNGIDIGQPDRFHGFPLTINQHMASTTTTGDIVTLFGQLSKYKIRQVREVRLYRMQERYRESDQDGFVAFIRQDGNLLDAGTAPVKKMVIGS